MAACSTRSRRASSRCRPYRDVYANADRGPAKLPLPAENRRTASADFWTTAVRDFALNRPGARPEGYPGAGSEAELVGITGIRPEWVYEGFESTLPNLIVIGNAMDHARLSKVPSSADDPEGQLEVCDQYNRGARVVNWLAHWIRAQGYQAKPHAGPWVGSLNLLPAAIASGFGELGKHGSLINREYGSSFRLAAVETDLPLLHDMPDEFGADDFCAGCQVCANECPPDAISREKVLVRGTLKWAVDFDRCIAYFNETFGCGICLAVCPWSTPGRAPKLAERFARRARERAGRPAAEAATSRSMTSTPWSAAASTSTACRRSPACPCCRRNVMSAPG
jgi:epoxyqueuosine reductase